MRERGCQWLLWSCLPLQAEPEISKGKIGGVLSGTLEFSGGGVTESALMLVGSCQ